VAIHRVRDADRDWGAVSLANGLLFVPNNATLYVMNAQTGDELLRLDTGGTIGGGAPAIAQGRVVVKSGMLWNDPATKLNDQIICYGIAGASGARSDAGAAAPVKSASFSAVYRDLHTQTCGDGMPNAGTLLPAAARDLVRFWIALGAAND
jgi:hypothetical protein